MASPLLANIALHRLEEVIIKAFPRHRVAGGESKKPAVVRYADDFVVLHRDLAVIEQVKQVVSDWLAGMGLEMKPSKTRITHTLHPQGGEVGFDFLGFNVRQHPVGKTHSGKSVSNGEKMALPHFVGTLLKLHASDGFSLFRVRWFPPADVSPDWRQHLCSTEGKASSTSIPQSEGEPTSGGY